MGARTQRSTRFQRIRRRIILGANVVLLGALGVVVHQKMKAPAHVERTRAAVERAHTVETQRAPFERRTPHVKAPAVPTKPLHFSEIPKGNYCTMYARLVAEKLYGMKYQRGDAWDFAARNRSIWEGQTTRVSEVAHYLQPGQVIGLYNPHSSYNGPKIKYTHTATYVGEKDGKHWVMQRIGVKDRLEPMEDFLVHNPGWKIREIIEPKK